MSQTYDVHPDLRVLLKTIDATLLGRRLRHARQRAGLTQGEAAGTTMSTAYISRIEAGQRRPGPELLSGLAQRLQCSPEELLAPDESVDTYDLAVVARVTLELDYAELELRTGSLDAALARATAVLEEAETTTAVPVGLRRQASLLHALAMESLGNLQDAIIELEDLVADEGRDAPGRDDIRMLRALISLSRGYRDSGDYARAVDIGDRAEALVEATHLHGSAEGLQLAVTVAAAHYERGDVSHAVRLCMRAIESAEDLDSPAARAAAYWNSSIMQSRQGHVSAALPLAEKAIALLDETTDARNQARLRTVLAWLQLQMDPPELDAAIGNFTRAELELELSDSSESDVARNQIGLARARYLSGDLVEAEELTTRAYAMTGATVPLLAAEARVLQGQVAAARGSVEDAVAAFREAILVLSAVGADRGAAQLWFELGGLLQSCGQTDDALDAYRRAAASSGLTSRTSVETGQRMESRSGVNLTR